MTKKLIIISFFLLAMALPALAQDSIVIAEADEITANDLEVEEPSILPNSPFYFLKEGWRKAREVFTFNNLRKIELKEKFSAERLVELRKMAAQGVGAGIIEKATDNYQREKEQIRVRVMALEQNAEQNQEINAFMEKFTHQQILHQQILEKLGTQVPAEVRERIQEQREEHLNQFKEVMLKLENNDDIPEKLEEALNAINAGEFGEIRKMELFQKMEEIMPEEVQERFRERAEQQIQVLKEKIETMPEEEQERFQQFIEEIPVQAQERLQIIEKVRVQLQEGDLKESIKAKIEVKTQTRNQNQVSPQE